MKPYFCVFYRISDTYRINFQTAGEAITFQAVVGGDAYSCDCFGNLLEKLVLAYRPKIKTKAAKRRLRRNKRAVKADGKPKSRESTI